jgi:dTDP-4-amino-4,6-dideoxygalactose transaminase
VRLKRRDEAKAVLEAEGIPSRVYYPVPLYRQEPFRQEGRFPVCEKASSEVLSLPFCPFITEERQQRVADSLRPFA